MFPESGRQQQASEIFFVDLSFVSADHEDNTITATFLPLLQFARLEETNVTGPSWRPVNSVRVEVTNPSD
jgi:hypothetical protein